MTREKLSKTLDYWREGLISKSKVLELIWGQPFDGETEKIKPSTEEAEARAAELREQISALVQVHEVIKAEARVAELRDQMSALAQAHEIWLRDAEMKEERR